MGLRSDGGPVNGYGARLSRVSLIDGRGDVVRCAHEQTACQRCCDMARCLTPDREPWMPAEVAMTEGIVCARCGEKVLDSAYDPECPLCASC